VIDMANTVKVKLVKGLIGTKQSHRATVRGLGLRKLNSESRPRRHAGGARHDQQGRLSRQSGVLSIADERRT